MRKRAAQPGRVGLLTVGQTARIVGVSASTLRLWENVGLITPARSNGRYRLYSRELLEVLKRIKYLRDVKRLNIPGISQVVGNPSKHKAAGAVAAKHTTRLGAKLRQMRQRQGFGVVEAARRANISAGFLSSIELSRANPSVATLQRLTATYGATVLDLYDLPRRPKRLIHQSERRVIETAAGIRMELLSTGAKQLQSQLFHVPPGAGSDGAYSHDGEEFIHMLSGTLEVWLDELECHTLHVGDSFWFESTHGHRWFNPGEQAAVLLWINTPPTF